MIAITWNSCSCLLDDFWLVTSSFMILKRQNCQYISSKCLWIHVSGCLLLLNMCECIWWRNRARQYTLVSGPSSFSSPLYWSELFLCYFFSPGWGKYFSGDSGVSRCCGTPLVVIQPSHTSHLKQICKIKWLFLRHATVFFVWVTYSFCGWFPWGRSCCMTLPGLWRVTRNF